MPRYKGSKGPIFFYKYIINAICFKGFCKHYYKIDPPYARFFAAQISFLSAAVMKERQERETIRFNILIIFMGLNRTYSSKFVCVFLYISDFFRPCTAAAAPTTTWCFRCVRVFQFLVWWSSITSSRAHAREYFICNVYLVYSNVYILVYMRSTYTTHMSLNRLRDSIILLYMRAIA